MYAVILTGGKQYRVRVGDVIKVETLPSDQGSTVQFDHVLLVGEGESAQIGKPYLKNAVVSAEVVSHGRHDKIRIIKYKRRKHQLKWQGHRQNYTEIRISNIKA